MKYKFLRISLLSALAVLFGGTALGAFMAAAEEAADDAGSGGSETVILSWSEEPTLSNSEGYEYEKDVHGKNVATWSNGYSITINNATKDQGSGNNLTIDGTSYKTIKLSNGAQNKLILPEGKVTKKITLYSYVNWNVADKGTSEHRDSYWKEVAGVAHSFEDIPMTSYMSDKSTVVGMDKYTFTFDATNEVTFTNTGEQCCYVIAIEVEDAPADDDNTEDPAIAQLKDALTTYIGMFDDFDENDYTEESAAAMLKAIEDAKAALADENATAESLNAAIEGLMAAMSELKEKPAVDEGTWKTVGTAILEDPWVLPGLGIDQHADENKWEVPLERNTENENLYRLVDPYHAEGPVKAYNDSEEVGYIVFDVTDPDHVLFSSNTGAGFKNRNKEVIATRVSEVYAYNRLTQRYYHKENGKKDLATVIADYGEKIPFTTFKDGVITLGSKIVDGETIYDACFGDETDPQGLPDGFDWENGADMTGTITLKIGDAGDEATTRRWDFTKWSNATVTNLLADAAASKVEGWSDVEKEADAAAGADPTETSKDNCFWAASSMKADEIYGLSANGIVIDELKGLKFTGALNSRNLAIAVNYPVALSTYEGGAYLWLGGANKKFITIPAVAAGTTIKMGVESHKTTDPRGVDLLVNGESIGEFKPTVYEEHTWTVPAGEAVDVVIDNTNGCHIYFIEVEQDQEALLAVATEDLKTVIAAAEAIEDLTIYTEESAQALTAALTAAKAAEGTVKAQTEAAYALINAKAALQKAEPDPDPVTMTYKVNEVAGDIVFRTTEGEALEGTDVKVAYRLYNVDEEGQLYTKKAGLSTKSEFNYVFNLATEGQTETIEYAAVDTVTNVVFLSEGEDIEGLKPVAGNAGIRSSNSAAAYPAEDTEIVTLEAGIYKIVAVIHDSRKADESGKNPDSDWTFKAGEQEITFHCGTINFQEISSEEFTLNAATKIILAQNETEGKAGLDVMYIVKTGDVVADGINAIEAEAENGAVYNLQGQKVQNVQKGIYIIGGKKVVIK